MKKLLSKTNLIGYLALIIGSVCSIIYNLTKEPIKYLNIVSIVFYSIAIVMFILYLIWRIKIKKD